MVSQQHSHAVVDRLDVLHWARRSRSPPVRHRYSPPGAIPDISYRSEPQESAVPSGQCARRSCLTFLPGPFVPAICGDIPPGPRLHKADLSNTVSDRELMIVSITGRPRAFTRPTGMMPQRMLDRTHSSPSTHNSCLSRRDVKPWRLLVLETRRFPAPVGRFQRKSDIGRGQEQTPRHRSVGLGQGDQFQHLWAPDHRNNHRTTPSALGCRPSDPGR